MTFGTIGTIALFQVPTHTNKPNKQIGPSVKVYGQFREIDEQWQTLERLGYLVDRRTSLTSNAARATIVAFRNATKDRFDRNFIQIRSEDPLMLSAPREVIDEFDRFLSEEK